MGSPARYFPAFLAFSLLGLSACSEDPVYVLGRLEGSGGTTEPSCAPPTPLRDYVFFGLGTELVDRQGGPPGELLNGATLDDSGELALDGQDDYVNLPNGIITGFDEVTVVVWIRYQGGAAYTRIFDFGIGSDGEDPAERLGTVGRNYLAATPMTGFVPRYLAALITSNGSGGQIAAVTDRQLDRELHMLAVAASPQTLELFHDAALIAKVPNSVSPGGLENVNNWLGRSQYDQDPHLHANYAGVQVYGQVLAECALRALHSRGPARR